MDPVCKVLAELNFDTLTNKVLVDASEFRKKKIVPHAPKFNIKGRLNV